MPGTPIVTLSFTSVIVALQVSTIYDPGIFNALVLDRTLILQGEFWRLLTAHLVHTDPGHLMVNVLGLAAAGWLLESVYGRAVTFNTIILSSLVISLVILGVTDIQKYCGFSGVVNSVFVLAVLSARRNLPRVLPGVLISVYALKLIADLSGSNVMSGQYDWPVLPEAHVTGMLVGVSVFLLLAIRRATRNQYNYLHNI